MIQFNPDRPRGIVWLASYPKSGNTWLRAFLHALLRSTEGNPVDAIDLNKMDDFRRSTNDVHRYATYLSGPATAVAKSEIAMARPKVQEDIVAESTGLVLVKTHNARIQDHGFPAINQAVSAGAIYVVRNPLDVAISFARFFDRPIDQMIDDMATSGWGSGTNDREVYYITGSWSENVVSWTKPAHPVILVVRYEDMLDHPQETFSRIAAHIRSGATRQQISQAIELSSFERLREAERAKGFQDRPQTAERFFREGRSGQWKDVLSGPQVKRVTDIHGEQMRRFGYA